MQKLRNRTEQGPLGSLQGSVWWEGGREGRDGTSLCGAVSEVNKPGLQAGEKRLRFGF